MIPAGFTPVEPAAVGRGDHIPVKIGVDKRQIVTVSFNVATAAKLGLIDSSAAEPTVTRKLACGVNQQGRSFGLFPVPTEQAGWDVTLTKGIAQRAQVQIPLPALFNVVAEPFRQEAATGHYSFAQGGIVIEAEAFFFAERQPEAEPEAEAEQRAEVEQQAEAEPKVELEVPDEPAPTFMPQQPQDEAEFF